MTGTFKTIDYRLRPAKHAERAMLMEMFRRFRFAPVHSYKYVGLGSVAFIDFKMAHKHLGISDMVSIEATADVREQVRFKRNNPYRDLVIKFGHTSAILPTIPFDKPAFVWLDFDNNVDKKMADDVAHVARRAQSGSFIGFTFPNVFPAGGSDAQDRMRQDRLGNLKDFFPSRVPDDAKARMFDGGKYGEFIRNVFEDAINKALSDADVSVKNPADRRRSQQVCFFKYKDGMQMATLGWVIYADRDHAAFKECALDSLEYYRDGSDAFRIDVPLVTPMEIRVMERRIPTLLASPSLHWIPLEAREAFKKSYRFLPHFSPIEQI